MYLTVGPLVSTRLSSSDIAEMSSAPSGASRATSPTARTGAGGGAASLMACSTSQRRLSSAHCAL
eukprot:652889-Prymnesium_polylepis.1